MSISIQMIAYITTANIRTVGVSTVLGTSICIQSTLIDIGTGMPIEVQSVTIITATNV